MKIQADIGVGLELEMGLFAVTNQVPPELFGNSSQKANSETVL